MSVTPLALAEVVQLGKRVPTKLVLGIEACRALIAELQEFVDAHAPAEEAVPEPSGEDPLDPATWQAAGLPARLSGVPASVRKAELADAAGGHHVLVWGDPRADEILAAGGVLLRVFDEPELAAVTADQNGGHPGTVEAAAGSLPWSVSEDGWQWRAVLPDGRTAVIERLEDGDEQGGGASFLPKVHESRGDFESGPVCASVLGAAAWCAEFVAGPAAWR